MMSGSSWSSMRLISSRSESFFFFSRIEDQLLPDIIA